MIFTGYKGDTIPLKRYGRIEALKWELHFIRGFNAEKQVALSEADALVREKARVQLIKNQARHERERAKKEKAKPQMQGPVLPERIRRYLERKPDVIEAIRAGNETVKDIAKASELSTTVTYNYLTEMVREGCVTKSRLAHDGSGLIYCYKLT